MKSYEIIWDTFGIKICKIGRNVVKRRFCTSFESSDQWFLEPQPLGSGSSFILCHAILKIDILYENVA